MRNISSNGVKS